jgi:aerobic carbon-monoxide dehydrogenase large subunit
MNIVEDSPPTLTALDRPNSYIGRSVPRPNLARLSQGRAQFVTDVVLPRMAHVAFVRSPHAHARIKAIDTAEAKTSPGVIAVVTGAELSKVITPWVGVLTHLKGIKSAPQHASPSTAPAGRARRSAPWSRARAPRPRTLRAGRGRVRGAAAGHRSGDRARPATPVIHPDLGDNLTFERVHSAGDVDKALRRGRRGGGGDLHVRPPHRRVPRAARHRRRLERRRAALTVYHATQAPHMMQNMFAKHLELPKSTRCA